MSNDLVAAGFERLDADLLHPKQPPKIQWGRLYRDKTDAEKVTYLEKLAATMNHAAAIVQNERNLLGELCEKKEQQIQQLSAAMKANNEMLQSEVTKMNEQRQGYNAEVARLNRLVRDGDIG